MSHVEVKNAYQLLMDCNMFVPSNLDKLLQLLKVVMCPLQRRQQCATVLSWTVSAALTTCQLS